MQVFTQYFIYSSFVSINIFPLHHYIPITIHLQKAFYPQVHGRLIRSLLCRKMAGENGWLSKNRKLGEMKCYQTLKLELI
jgi:hypothetical protein